MSDEKPPFDLAGLLGQVMDQARSVQGRIQGMQDRVRAQTVEGGAGGGLVKVVATGAGRVQQIRVDPALLAGKDAEMLEDLLVAGVNDALRRAQEMVERELGQIAGGVDLGGLGDMLQGFGKKP